jgi:FtsH-binding integral membrane protein
MDALIPFIVFCQALGAFVGAGATIWGELSYLRYMRDGKIDHAERTHLRAIAHGLRFGMTLLLVASFALVVVAYVSHTVLQPALTSSYWTLIVLALIVVYVSWALSRGHISFALGSALAFTAWWFLAYLTIGLMPPLSFGATLAFFVIATGIFYAILQYARFLARPKK